MTGETGKAYAQLLLRVFLGLTPMATAYWLAPTFFSWKPALALLLFAGLLLVRRQEPRLSQILPPLSVRALLLFMLLYAVLASLALCYSREIAAAVHISPLLSLAFALSKVLALLPAFALFPLSRGFLRAVSHEAAAACLGLFTFSPDRFFELIWPLYSRVIAVVIAALCHPLLPATYITAGTDGPVVVGPRVDMVLGISCSGIRSIVLFQFLFAVIVIARWNTLNRLRSLVFYISTCAALLLANWVRLAIVHLTANLTSTTVNLGWPLFVLTFVVLIWQTYDWMTPPQPHGARSK